MRDKYITMRDVYGTVRTFHADKGFIIEDDDDADRVLRTTDPYVWLNTSPHYTDKCFNTAQTLFGAEENGLHYVYSDRLRQWDSTKMEESVKVAEASGYPRQSAAYYEALISHYEGKRCEVRHVLAGVNVSSGYPYYVLGYRYRTR